MDCHGERPRTHSLLERVGAVIRARPIASASYRLVAPSNSEYSLLERIRYWSSTARPFCHVYSKNHQEISKSKEKKEQAYQKAITILPQLYSRVAEVIDWRDICLVFSSVLLTYF